MPKITICAYAALAEILGFRRDEILAPVENVMELIDLLTHKYDASFREKLIDLKTGKLRSTYRILVNGRDITSLSGLKTQVQKGDEITLFPPVSGG